MDVYKKYLAYFAAFLVLLCGGYYALFCFQMGAPIEAEYWLRDERFFKEDIAQRTQSPKLVIVCGSNGLFGIDSAELQNYVKMPVVNLSTHGGLPLDWMLDFAATAVQKGDVLVLPFEWDYYMANYTRPSQWMTQQVVAWDESYFKTLDFIRKIQFIASISYQEFVKNLLTKLRAKEILKKHPDRRLKTREMVLAFYRRTDRAESRSYSYLNNNRYGDMMPNWPGGSEDLDSYAYITAASNLEPLALARLKNSIDDWKHKGISVFVTFPPMTINPVTASKQIEGKIAEFENVLRKQGIPLLGTQSDYYFPQTCFFDSPFHLNCEGKKIRTEILGKQLTAVLVK